MLQGGGSIETAIRKYGNNDVRWSTQGMMRLMPDAMKRLFEHTLGDIRQAIGDVLSNPKVTGKVKGQKSTYWDCGEVMGKVLASPQNQLS